MTRSFLTTRTQETLVARLSEQSAAYLITVFQVGSMNKGDFDVGTGLVGAPAYVRKRFCTKWLRLHCRRHFLDVETL